MSFTRNRAYLTSESHASLGSAKIRAEAAKAGEVCGGRAKSGLLLMKPKELSMTSEAGRRNLSSVAKNRRNISLSGDHSSRMFGHDEGDLIDMLNDPGSELYRLFAHHNPNKSPQQCFFDLKYSSPDDTESRSLYGKVLKYAQLYNKLGKRIKSGSARKPENSEKLKGGAALQTEKLLVKGNNQRDKKKDSVQAGGACDLIKEKKLGAVSTEKVGTTANKRLSADREGIGNPLTSMTEKNPEDKVDFDPDAALLRSYRKALDTTNVGTQMRLAMLDSDYNKIGQRCEGSDGTLSHLLRRHRSEPPRTEKCYVRNLPMRANRIQHSLSSVSSIEVHKTNTSCSMSSTSISISTCEFEEGNDTVQNIMNKICTLESQKQRCRDTTPDSLRRDMSAIRKKQRGLLVEFQRERERQRRKLVQENQNDGCGPCGSLQALKRNKYAASIDGAGVYGNYATTKTADVNSCGLSASLFGNSAALKAFERKSGMTIEELLKQREEDVAYRKQRAQELLKWHQRIQSEEECVNQMETQLMLQKSEVSRMGNSSPMSHRTSTKIDSPRIHNACECCPPKCYCDPCNCCKCGCDDSCKCKDEKRHKEKRICAENPPLCQADCCCAGNQSKTYCISGRTLNKIWRDISGLPCDKYNNCFEYNLTDADFEELYATAKRERKIMRAGLQEDTRCPNFEREMTPPKKKHFAFGEEDKMGEAYGCRMGQCDKDEEWLMMFHQPKQEELGTAPPTVVEEEIKAIANEIEMGVDDKEKATVNGDDSLGDAAPGSDEKDDQDKTQERKLKSVTVARKLFDAFKEQHGIGGVQREINGMWRVVGRGEGKKEDVVPELADVAGSQLKVEEGPDEIINTALIDEGEAAHNKHQEEILSGPESCSDAQKRFNGTVLLDAPEILQSLVSPSPPPPEEMVEVLDLSTTTRRAEKGNASVTLEDQQKILRNLPPVPFSYIVKEVPSVQNVLAMVHRIQEGGATPESAVDLSNPYLRILSQEIPYLVADMDRDADGLSQVTLENTVIDRLEQLRKYQLNLKRAHMGIGELVFEGPHYPHVQKIQDLIEYPLAEEDGYVRKETPVDQVVVQRSNQTVGWSPPYKKSSTAATCQRNDQVGGDQMIVAGEYEMHHGRSCDGVVVEEEDDDYFLEDDEFLDYYDMQQSERQILAIFTDHIMNSMLDDVVEMVQRHMPRRHL